MSRRFSDAPINLIARIPTPEQISAARTEKRSFGENVRESGAICFRRVAEMVVQLGQLGRKALSFVESKMTGSSFLNRAWERMHGKAEPVESSAAVTSDDFPGGIKGTVAAAPLDRPVPAPRPPVTLTFTVPEPAETAVESVSLEDVAALRTELLSQRQEVARLSAQLQELKALVGSQQQVLRYLGQEMETRQMPILAASLAPPSPKKTRVARVAKSSATVTSGSQKASQRPALNL